MNEAPLISIITPSFNQGNFIEETILSILNQSYKNFELIIIDGGSTDHTVDVIKKYENKIAYWVSEKDNGQTDAILKGLKKCKGELFNWINSDDKLSENSLKNIVEIYLKNDKPDLIAGDILFFGNDQPVKRHLHTNYWNNIPRTLGVGQMCQPGMFYKTEVIKKIGLNASMHYSMDVELFFRFNLLLKNPQIVYTDELLAEFRIHSASKSEMESDKKGNSKFLQERITILNNFAFYFKDKKSQKKLSDLFSIETEKIADGFPVEIIAAKRPLLRNCIDYFFVDQLFQALYVFDKTKIRRLIWRINWLRIDFKLTKRVLGKLFKHVILFLGNVPKRKSQKSIV